MSTMSKRMRIVATGKQAGFHSAGTGITCAHTGCRTNRVMCAWVGVKYRWREVYYFMHGRTHGVCLSGHACGCTCF